MNVEKTKTKMAKMEKIPKMMIEKMDKKSSSFKKEQHWQNGKTRNDLNHKTHTKLKVYEKEI